MTPPNEHILMIGVNFAVVFAPVAKDFNSLYHDQASTMQETMTYRSLVEILVKMMLLSC
jgi:hypothetical protein